MMERRIIRDLLLAIVEKKKKDGGIIRGRVSSTSLAVNLEDENSKQVFADKIVEAFRKIQTKIPADVVKQFLEIGANDLEALQQKLYKGFFNPKPVAAPPPKPAAPPQAPPTPPTQAPPAEIPPGG